MLWCLGLYVLTLALAAWWTHVAGVQGRRWGVLDLPDLDRKRHAAPTPRTGGLAICLALMAGLATAWGVGWATGRMDGLGPSTCRMLVSALALCAVGVWDDRYGMTARQKLLWQVLAISPFVFLERSAQSVMIFGWTIESPVIASSLVLLWLVACSNFINLLDGMDGLAATLGIVVCLASGGLAGWNGQLDNVLVAVALAGALSGFLLHNWPPARIFMGDCGSLPLGFLVGGLALQASAKKATGLTLVVPAVLLAVPLIDTSMAIVRRKLTGRKIGQGDRGHIHHTLRDRGLSSQQTLLAVGGMSLFAAVGAVVATLVGNDLVAMMTGAILVGVLVGGRIFGFQETMLLARVVEAIWQICAAVPRLLRVRLVALRFEAATAQGELRLWHKIIRRARRLEVQEIEFVLEPVTAGQAPVQLHWNSKQLPQNLAMTWETSATLRRDLGGLAMFRVRGISNTGVMPGAAAELTELLVTLCRAFPEPSAPLLSAPAPGGGASTSPPSVFIPWRAPVAGEREAVPQRVKDAA
ncbi:MAG: MraY family glycosyltransferase [Planctomycetaceae bacterium]